MIANGQVDGVVAAKLDRLTRSVLHFASLLEWFERAGATLVALDLGIDTSSPGGRLVANVFASVAEWERDTIAARTRDGMAILRDRGEPVSRPSLADQPKLAARVAKMRQAGLTYQAIADRLNQERVPTLRGGATWRVSSVQTAAGYRRPPARRVVADLPALPKRRRAAAQ
jgi:DNA invertase Pin-like site-specific DNA recombinase